MVENLPAIQETWVRCLSWEDPLEEGMATHFSILAWRIPMDRGAWWATDHRVTKTLCLVTESCHLSTYIYIYMERETESLCCTPETDTRFKTNSTSIFILCIYFLGLMMQHAGSQFPDQG